MHSTDPSLEGILSTLVASLKSTNPNATSHMEHEPTLQWLWATHTKTLAPIPFAPAFSPQDLTFATIA